MRSDAMTTNASRLIEDLQAMLVHIDELAKRVLPENEQHAANGQSCEMSALLMNARTKVTELKDTLTERVHAADQQMHDNAWKAVGIAAGVAFIAGLVVARR